MKILLIGEFSGVHNNLKKGLERKGHQVFLVGGGDSWKKFPSDFNTRKYASYRYIGSFLNLLYCLWNIRVFIGYDVVQFISPFVFPGYRYSRFLYQIIFRRNKKVFLYACGTDPYYIGASKTFRYSPYESKSEYPLILDARTNAFFGWFLEKINGVIPAMFDYAEGYRQNNYPKLRKTIPLPVDITEVENTKKKLEAGEKIVILHGLIREGFKGSSYIKEALKKIAEDYNNEVEIIVDGKLPFPVYKEILNKADIVVDQCKTYSYGMNAILSMAMGKVVLSGCTIECKEEFGMVQHPIISIEPNVEQIYTALKKLIEDRSLLLSIKENSREVAIQLHDVDNVVPLFIKEWSDQGSGLTI